MADSPPKPLTRPLRADIQALRGLAVIVVVCFHAKLAFFQGSVLVANGVGLLAQVRRLAR